MTGNLTEDLKERVHDKLVKSKAMDHIDHRIKQGMCAAIESLRGDKEPKAIFTRLGFKKKRVELIALQSIYQFLASVGLNWTLETLTQDTSVKPQSDAVPLTDWFTNPPKDGVDLNDEDEAGDGNNGDAEEEDDAGAEDGAVGNSLLEEEEEEIE
jgi:hypothetical protein